MSLHTGIIWCLDNKDDLSSDVEGDDTSDDDGMEDEDFGIDSMQDTCVQYTGLQQQSSLSSVTSQLLQGLVRGQKSVLTCVWTVVCKMQREIYLDA